MKRSTCVPSAHSPLCMSAKSMAATFDERSFRTNWHVVISIIAAFTVAVVFVGQAKAQATKYKIANYQGAAKIEANLKSYTALASGFASAKDASKFNDDQKEKIQEFYQRYVPSKLTQYQNPAGMNEMMEIVNKAMNRSIRVKSANYVTLGRWMFPVMSTIAKENYHPAARVNAIQFLSKVGKPTSQGFVVPYPTVLEELLSIYQAKQVPDGVRAVALQGMEQFVRYNPVSRVNAKTKASYATLTKEMNQLLGEPAPVGRDELAHAFLKRYAVSILSDLAADGSLGKQLVSISIDDGNPNLLALHSAAAIGSLPAKMNEGDVEHREVLKQWASRMLAAYNSEIERIESLNPSATNLRTAQPPAPERFLKTTTVEEEVEKPRRTGGGMGMGMDMDDMMGEMGMDGDMMEMEMGDMGGMMGMGMEMGMMGGFGGIAAQPQPAEVVASRRQLNFVIQQILLGVTGEAKVYEDVLELKASGGVIAATPQDSVSEVQDWLTTVYELTNSLNDETLDDQRKFLTGLKEQVVILEELIDSSGKTQEVDPNSVPGGFDPLAQF